MPILEFSTLAERPTLKEAQLYVGGYVELVYLRNAQMLVNEDGLQLGLPVNREASYIAGRMIVGNAIILKNEAMWKGDD